MGWIPRFGKKDRATPQQHITMSDVLMFQWLSSFRPSVSQNNTNITTNNTDVPQENHGALPIGLRVLSCNRCLADNWLEMIFSSVETEALTKVVHLCDLEVVASKEDDEPRNSPILIQERQNHLMAILRRAVNFLARIYGRRRRGRSTLTSWRITESSTHINTHAKYRITHLQAMDW